MQTELATTELEHLFRSDILPALPHSALSIVDLANEDDFDAGRFTMAIEADPGLMGQVLRFVNSTEFQCSGQIMSVQQALTRVGARAISNFTVWNAVFSVNPNPTFGPFELKLLWRDSLRRAVFARALARSLNLETADDLFAAALLQDMAIPLLLEELPSEYDELVQRRADEGRRLSGLEQEVFGWDHADAAAMLAKRWHLPARFIEIIAQHTHIEEIIAGGEEMHGNMCVALAALLPSCRDTDWDQDEKTQFILGYEKLTRKPFDKVNELLVEVDCESATYLPLLHVELPKRKLADLVSDCWV